MHYPLTLRFKLLALTPQIYVTDASGREVLYVKQKMFRLREKVEVHADSSRRHLVATIQADRIIDWSAKYTFRDPSGNVLGAVGRRGMRSLWSAHYDVFGPGSSTQPILTIREEKPFIKVLDGILSGIPVIGILSSYLLHPTYLATRPGGPPVMRLSKQPAFFEGRFQLSPLMEASEQEQTALLLAFLMMNLLERSRG